MQLHDEPIKLDPDADGVPFEPSDWRMCPRHFGVMHYLPTGAQYYVDLPEDTCAKETVTVMDFRAWLVHVREEAPTPLELLEQGRAAIAVFLIEQEYWKPEIVDIPDRPRTCRKTSNHDKLCS